MVGWRKSAGMEKERAPVKCDLSVGEDKSGRQRVPKGYVPVLVGEAEELERFLVRVEVFNHPSFVGLLEMTAEEFGYRQQGVLKISCDVVHFRQVLEAISKTL